MIPREPFTRRMKVNRTYVMATANILKLVVLALLIAGMVYVGGMSGRR